MDGKNVIDPNSDGDAAPSSANEEAVAGGTAASASEEIGVLREKAAKAAEYYEQLLRTAADLDNYRKRAARERQEAVRFANEALLEKLLPVLDNFEMALAAATAPNTSIESLQSGVAMIFQQLKAAMSEAGLQEVDATGASFDPNLHEAISQRETTEVPEGQVVQQVRKGYRLRDRLLRPASVVVAKTPAADPR